VHSLDVTAARVEGLLCARHPGCSSVLSLKRLWFQIPALKGGEGVLHPGLRAKSRPVKYPCGKIASSIGCGGAGL
jgi:hypothetical protein